MGVRNVQNGARRSSAEKLTCTAMPKMHTAVRFASSFYQVSGHTAVPKRHMAVRRADGGIRILTSLLTSQGQAGDFTSINPRAGDQGFIYIYM